MGDTYKYKAFISYSHVDERAAARLFNRLEAYRLPHRLREGASADQSRRLGVFFRDRDELRASGDLSRQIKDALSQSEFLIVLCSPHAAQSPWVAKEILEFKQLHGELNILAVILDGEPHAEDKPGVPECFPKPLRYRLNPDRRLGARRAEPLAADFRPGGDGARLGFLKLAAALADMELARLLDRDQERRHRRVTAITLVSATSALLFGGLTLFALDARRDAVAAQSDAIARRDDAEGLIEFMLTDLRNELEPVGRLDALQAVGDKAEDYYDAQALGDMSEDVHARRAKVFHLLGEIDSRQGRFDAATQRWADASKSTQALLARDPDNPQRIFDHAQSVFWVGYAEVQNANAENAETQFQEYYALAQRLVEMDPVKREWREELAYAHMNLGTLNLQMLQQPKEALAHFESAAKIREAMLEGNAGSRSFLLTLANNYAWLADASKADKEMRKAQAYRTKQVDIFDRVQALSKADYDIESRKLNALLAIAKLEQLAGDPGAAVRMLVGVTEAGEELIAHDPGNDRWRQRQIMYYCQLALSYLDHDQLDKAIGSLVDADRHVAHIDVEQDTSFRKKVRTQLFPAYVRARIARRNVDGPRALLLISEIVSEYEEYTEEVRSYTLAAHLLTESYLMKSLLYSALRQHAASDLAWKEVESLIGVEIDAYSPEILRALDAACDQSARAGCDAITEDFEASGYNPMQF